MLYIYIYIYCYYVYMAKKHFLMYLLVRIIHIIYITSVQLKIVPKNFKTHVFRLVRNNKLTNITIILFRLVKLLLWRANELSTYYEPAIFYFSFYHYISAMNKRCIYCIILNNTILYCIIIHKPPRNTLTKKK